MIRRWTAAGRGLGPPQRQIRAARRRGKSGTAHWAVACKLTGVFAHREANGHAVTNRCSRAQQE